ncbi:MAG: hypothetical protein AAF629_24160, partial [Chloroflexota bacterium]
LGDYEDCAQTITWLEMHGLPVLGEVRQYAPNWVFPKSQAATILYEDDTLAVIDAQANGGLLYGSLAVDLAYLKAMQAGFAHIKLKQAKYRQLIIPSLVAVAQRGVHLAVFWQESGQHHQLTVDAHADYPCYWIYDIDSTVHQPPNAQTLSILCSPNMALKQPLDVAQSGYALTSCLNPDDFATNYAYHNERGLDIDVDIWQQLITLSKAVLVESTALSRLRGAGELASDQ